MAKAEVNGRSIVSQFGFAEAIGTEVDRFCRLVKIAAENSAQVGMRHGVAFAIRSEIKALHPLEFRGLEDLGLGWQILRSLFERPRPEMNLLSGNRREGSGGRPRKRGDHV